MSKLILFQGDSITDCCRSREDLNDLGSGYPCLVATSLKADYPEQFDYINRGVSGNRSVDLLARIKNDIINLAPDYMSILIGVNDTWHELGENNGVSLEKYELIYDMILSEVKAALPDIKIMLLEPFVLHGEATTDSWDAFSGDVFARAKIVKKLAEKHDCKFVPLQDKFNDAAKKSSCDAYWLMDGVHPYPQGHEIIKREWLKAFEEIK